MNTITPERLEKAYAIPKKDEVVEVQKLPVRYHVESGLPTEDRPKLFLESMAAILKHTNYGFALDHFARTTARCARCATGCPIHEVTGRPEHVPCYRSKLLLDVYKRHFTLGGKVKARLQGDPGLTDGTIQEMAQSFWDCTACRKCVNDCPMGIDHGLVTHLARWILAEIGIAPRALVVSTREQLIGDSRNTSAIPLPALIDSLEFMEEEMAESKGAEVKFPVDQQGAKYLFVAPVSDYMMEAETLMGIACVMHATGDSWTIGTQNYDAINYGLFYSDQVLEKLICRIEAEADRLGCEKILVGECGHASRSAKFFYNQFAQHCKREVVNILEYTYEAYKAGKLTFDRDMIKEKVTYHDPCNLARSGWVVEQPRELIRAFIKDFVEMTPNRRNNYCCGGGGGSVSIDEIRPWRTTIGGRRKAEQVVATGADIVIAPCANCKKQIREVLEDNETGVEMTGLHDLIYKALILSEDGVAWREPSEEDWMGDEDWTPPEESVSTN